MKTNKKELLAQLQRLARRVESLETKLDNTMVNFAREAEHTHRTFERITEGMGGVVWRTKAGHARFIALLSTEHLHNIMLWPNATERVKLLCAAELKRRTLDDQWRRKERAAKRKKPSKKKARSKR